MLEVENKHLKHLFGVAVPNACQDVNEVFIFELFDLNYGLLLTLQESQSRRRRLQA